MLKKAMMGGTAVLLVAAYAALPIRAQTQSGAGTASPPVLAAPAKPDAAADAELQEMQKLSEQAAQMKTQAEAALSALDAKQADLNNLSADARAAQQWVEGLIGVLQEFAGRYANDGPFMQSMSKHEEYVRSEASRALASVNPGDHLYGRQLEVQGKEITSMLSEGRAIAGRLTGEIDRLRNSAPQIGFARTIERTRQFIEVARGYLATARGVLEGAANLATKAESIVRPTVPSQ